jgi:hypothetical protein
MRMFLLTDFGFLCRFFVMTATLPILRSVKPEQHGKLYLEMRLNGEGVGEGWVQHYSPNYSDGAGFTRLPVEIKLVHLSCNFKYSYRGGERERERQLPLVSWSP